MNDSYKHDRAGRPEAGKNEEKGKRESGQARESRPLHLNIRQSMRNWLNSAGGRQKDKGSSGEFVRTMAIAIGIAIVFRSFLFEPFSIPSGSMIPTLKVGDYLFVSKYSYGYSRYSFPFGLVPLSGRVFANEPERGDVIVFRKPGEESVDYIKRLVGLPGDRIQVAGGILHINGTPVERNRLGAGEAGRGLFRFPATIYDETLPGGRTYRIQEFGDDGRMDNTPQRTVPAGHYFFMGDNRDNSRDSRAEVGFVPREHLVGRAEMLFFSQNGSAAIWEVWKWPFAIRFERIGMSIE